jgi:hypothetical protein
MKTSTTRNRQGRSAQVTGKAWLQLLLSLPRVLSWNSHKLMRPDVITASPMLSPGMMAAKGAARGGTTTRGAGRLRLQSKASGGMLCPSMM